MENIRYTIFGALLGASLCVAQLTIAQTGAPPKPAAELNNAEFRNWRAIFSGSVRCNETA